MTQGPSLLYVYFFLYEISKQWHPTSRKNLKGKSASLKFDDYLGTKY